MGIAYGITATLGPASAEEKTWGAMIDAGATAFRLNTSHLSLDDMDGWLVRLNSFFVSGGVTIPVVLDLQGSKWRLGNFPPVVLVEGQRIDLVLEPDVQAPGVLPVPHRDFFTAAALSDGNIVLNDAKIHLQLEFLNEKRLTAQVLVGGPISPNKGITYVSSAFRVETLGEKDRAVLQHTSELEWVRYAISYVKDAVEVQQFRSQVLKFFAHKGCIPYLIAKLERQPALDEAAMISQWVDELWLCRGDLGAELGIAGMAAAAHNFTRKVRDLPVPVFLAGQVLEHMTMNPTPTRSEVYTLYDALQNGYRGFVLSDETAIGRYAAASCRAAGIFLDE